ncbi:hypothetical protein KY334_05400 [Candidatus Woesearchaeota archaeon]|nr:hypothetical protein [Candidatus Woesearchaeota archaeon]
MPLGWYAYKRYSTRNRAVKQMEKLKKSRLTSLAKTFNLTEKQAETLQFTVWGTRNNLL